MNQTMRNERTNFHWIYWLAWAALLSLASVPVAFGDNERRHRDHDRGGRASQGDVEFMEQLADHETAALELAKAGDDKTRHEEMRNYLDDLEQATSRRIDRLAGWMDDWYRVDYQPRMDAKYADRVRMFRGDMQGNEFEIRLLKTTIEHHQQEAQMILQHEPRLEREELRQMARTLADRRLGDARRLRGWLKDWYDIDYTSQYDPGARAPRGSSIYR